MNELITNLLAIFIFNLSVKTPYTEDEILRFISITKKELPEIEKLLMLYSENGIHTLEPIIQLVKLGHYCG